MLEVEVKIILEGDAEKRLIEGADFVNEKVMADTYFDTPDFSLTTKDKWLRKRNNQFELKLPYDETELIGSREIDRYHELDSEDEIRRSLNITENKSLEEDLKNNNIIPFATIVTTRKNYKNGKFNVVIDELDYGYKLGEIEMVVEDNTKDEEAKEEVINFAKERGLKYSAKGIGKVIEYLRRHSPKHIHVLVKSGAVEESSLLEN